MIFNPNINAPFTPLIFNPLRFPPISQDLENLLTACATLMAPLTPLFICPDHGTSDILLILIELIQKLKLEQHLLFLILGCKLLYHP
jgi:hypothetical protein